MWLPLNYLILLRQEKLLPLLFTEIVTTPEVLEALCASGAPPAVRAWGLAPPVWLAVRSARWADPARQPGKGESSAISLAVELQKHRPDVTILLDERDGRAAARARGLRTAGTLAVLSEGARRGMIDLPSVLSELGTTSFHVKPAILDEALRLDGVRRRSQNRGAGGGDPQPEEHDRESSS